MAKISPVSIKYMVHASLVAEGALEKPDIIGALFGQTEGLLGADLEMRELQKEGKIGRIEADINRKDKRTYADIKIPTALDQSETTLIAAAIETIDRVGPCDAQIEIEKIEDVRGSKRDYIIERAKKLMQGIEGSADSRSISNEIKDSTRMGSIESFGEDKVACGDISGNEVILVEGRADVVNLLKNGVKNVVAMNGTKLPRGIGKLSEEKEVTMFVDGDRGGKLIISNVKDNARIAYIAIAPDGKEVEELTGKEILMNLRKKVPLSVYLRKEGLSGRNKSGSSASAEKIELNDDKKAKLKEIFNSNSDSGKSILLNSDLNEIKKVSSKSVRSSLKRSGCVVLIMDGNATKMILNSAEEAKVQVIVAGNFSSTDTNIKLLSF